MSPRPAVSLTWAAVWMHYSCWLRLPADPAVLARLGARLDMIFAEPADQVDDDLDRMAELAGEIEVRDRLAGLCPGCRS